MHIYTAARDHGLRAIHFICLLYIHSAWQGSGAHMQPYDQVQCVHNKAQVTPMCIKVDVHAALT